MKLYQFIAKELVRCEMLRNDPNRKKQFDECEAGLKNIEKNWLPSGSGIDSGCKIEYKLKGYNLEWFAITFGYHHMNDVGYYTHWSDYKVIVKPDWDGFNFTIKGRNTNGILEYLDDTFSMYLNCDRSDWKEFESGHFSNLTLTYFPLI